MPRVSPARPALLHGIIDYAGLFPPARLDIETALAHYLRYRDDADAWMLDRFIVPAAMLGAMAPLLPNADGASRRVPLTVIVGGGAGAAAARRSLAKDLDRVGDFAAAQGERAAVAALETRLPDAVARGIERAHADAAVADLLALVADTGLPPVELCVESPGGGEPAARDAPAIAALADATARGLPANVERLAYKLRCGGVEAAAFPACERVAAVILACRDRRVPLKATAGLHHPVRHRATDPPVMMHGFMNVIGAGLLAHATYAGEERIAACVAETDPAAFALPDGGFRWRDHEVRADAVAGCRRAWLLGFGSCSFDEPRDDLRRLGLLA